MKTLTAFFILIFSFTLFAQESSPESDGWYTPPKMATFAKFKYFKQVPDKTGHTLVYIKSSKQSFKLNKPFAGNKTKICYGASLADSQGHIDGIACVLEAVGGKSCAQLDFKKCADDDSISPVE